VVLVHDEVAGAQVGEGGERAAEPPVGAGRPLAEDLRVGQQHEAELAPDEAAARRGDREAKRGIARQVLPVLEQLGVDAAQQVLLPERLAAMREGDDDALAGAHEGGQLVLGLAQPAGGDRGPLRLEGERLALRERVELCGAGEVDRREPFLVPDATHLVGLPDEIRGAVEHGDELSWGKLPETGLRDVLDPHDAEPSLRRRIHGHVMYGVQRALGERRKGPHAFDLVAEELDAQRLAPGGREDVDEAAPHRELAALLDPLDPFVARERKGLGEAVDAGLVPDRELVRRRALPLRRVPFGERRSGRADEPAGGEHVERTGTLAHEMRRRLEARVPADASARQERHAVGAEEPRGCVGGVPRVGVLRQQQHERPVEVVVQRRDDEWQGRLRDSSARGQRLREGAETHVGRQRPHERVQRGPVGGGGLRVHDE
jgi:hypothetical protein